MNYIEQITQHLFFGQNPYQNFVSSRNPDNSFPYTFLPDELIETVLVYLKPKFIVEVGSFKGGSAIKIAHCIKKLNNVSCLICIDPFIGDINMRTGISENGLQNNFNRWLDLKHGAPQIYDQFLVNIIDSGHSDIVFPLVSTSSIGLGCIQRLHKLKNFPLADFIYLDSSHEPEETYLEIKNCWKTLNKGGFLIGDDWSWESVRNDVIRFCIDFREEITLPDEQIFGLYFDQKISGITINNQTISTKIALYKGQWILQKL
ncbi:MAG: hypothetical protein RIT27_2047 [Pseudomonadota bacterium]|jgi:cephalosporin hydroxylase